MRVRAALAVATVVAVLGGTVAMGAPTDRTSVRSPEDKHSEPPPPPGCQIDSECPAPTPGPGQRAECLAPRCDTQTGTCGAKILTGTAIPNMLMPSGAECYQHPAVCSEAGSIIAEQDQKVPLPDGQVCALPAGEQRVCNRSVCQSGSCIPVPDPSLKDRECGESRNEGCITKTPLCDDKGQCVAEAGKRLKAGAECAPPGELPAGLVIARPEYLPPSFIALFTDGGGQPGYSCGDDCKLQYCGDGIRNRREEDCDGSDLPPNPPSGSSCLPTCQLSSCEPKPERPIVCRFDAGTDSGIEERSIFSTEECRYTVTSKSVARPSTTCSEPTPGTEAVRTRATAFVPTDDKKGCRWVIDTSTIPAPPVECSLDAATGNGTMRRPVFSLQQCEYTLGTSEVRKPEPTCSEVERGRTATVSTPVSFIRVGDTCEWRQETKTITAQPRSCRFDATTGKAYEDRSVLSVSCEYVAQSQEIPKPAPECIDSGFNDLIFTQATTFNAATGSCAWNVDRTRTRKPSRDGCTVVGNTGTLITNTLVSDMQAVPPVCRWEENRTVVQAPQDTCEYKDGISTPPFEELQYLSGAEIKDLMDRLGKLTLTDHSINPETCTVSSLVYERLYPEVTSCANNGVMTTWAAHDTLFPFHGGQRVEPCSWIPKQQACQGPPFREPPLRGRAGSTAPPPSNPNPPPAPPPPPPPAPPAQCNFYTISSAAYITTPIGLNYSNGTQRSCIASRLGWAQSECNKNNTYGSGPEYLDDCIAGKLAPSGSVTLNAQCQVIASPPSDARLCSSAVYGYRASPISLVWGSGEERSDLAFSEFPLFSDAGKNVVVWKASASMPLLVFDPDHSGKITSPHQLFGDHFRGGNKGASWRDGYEALASLDANGNGEISGDELKPLALWFDRNRDGVSQDGEVRSLGHPEVDVRKLFFKGGVKNEKSSDIHLAIGFERMRDGKAERGASVDWYTEGAESKDALINKLTAMSRIDSVATPPVQSAQDLQTSYSRVKSPLNGAFVWRSKDEPFKSFAKEAPGGAMTFTEFSGGKLKGHLYVETDFAAGGPLKSQLDSVFVHGTVQDLPDGSKKITFRPLQGALAGTEFTSSAILSKDGSTLSGDTAVVLNYNGDVRRFSYTWTAGKR